MKLAIVLFLICGVPKVLPGAMNINFSWADYPASDLCVQQIKYLQENRQDLWTLEMLDSWGNFPPSGTFSGNSFDFGNFDQCIELKKTAPGPVGIVVGQHCTLLVPHRRFDNERSAKFMPPSRK